MIAINLIPRQRCANCPQLAMRGATRCVVHAAANSKGTQTRIEKRKAQGLCLSCNSVAAQGRSVCAEHLQRMRDRDQKAREQALLSGKCQRSDCAQPIVNGRMFCADHLQQANDRSSKHYQSFVSKRRCKTCGEPSEGKIRCVPCTDLPADEQRQREATRNENNCLYCGEPAERPLFTRTSLTSCLRCRAKLGYTGAVKARFKRARRGCLDSGREWTLSLEEYEQLIKQPCHYCNLPQDVHERGTGLDRCASTRGYHGDNVVSCCGVCNIVRNSWFTVDEMKLLGEVVRKIKLARTAKGNN